jgi:hypothetical protein
MEPRIKAWAAAGMRGKGIKAMKIITSKKKRWGERLVPIQHRESWFVSRKLIATLARYFSFYI